MKMLNTNRYHTTSNNSFRSKLIKMSYTYRLIVFVIMFVLITNFIYFTQCSKLRPSNNENNQTSNAKLINNKSIQLVVNYETLCPDSQRFIVNQLSKAISIFRNNLNIQLIPYGKASFKFNPVSRLYEFDCQHGSRECFGNMLHV